MTSSLRNLLSVAVLGCGTLVHIVNALPQFYNGFNPEDIIIRDVCIIGGGATGTYSAVRLREDMNQTVIVIEKEGHLGGHVNTYIDPVTHFPVDYGVLGYFNLPVTRNFFGRFGIPVTTVAAVPPFKTESIDLSTGKVDTGITPVNPAAALGAYAAELQKYPYLAGGYALPEPVPSDLLLPFGEFVKKYQIDAAVSIAWPFVEGFGDLLKTPTLYVMANFGLVHLDALQNGLLVPANQSNSDLYQKAQGLLGSDVLYKSHVMETYRADSGDEHCIIVQTPSGPKLIKAKKLLVTIPPKLNKLKGFDLDSQEISVFKQWQDSAYFCGVLRNTGIPDDIDITNSAPNTPYHLPQIPAITHIDFTGIPGLQRFRMLAQEPFSASQAKAQVSKSVVGLKAAGFNTTAPEFAALSSHTPTALRVPGDAVMKGFYKQLYALQGHKGTYYTGAAWAADYSSLLWQFTETVLPLVAA